MMKRSHDVSSPTSKPFKKLSISFLGQHDFGIKSILSRLFDLEIGDRGDYLIANERLFLKSAHVRDIGNYPVRVFYTGECLAPDFNLFDYAISFERLTYGDRHFTLPLSDVSLNELSEREWQDLFDRGAVHAKSGFCNFLYRNARAHPFRDAFFRLLSAYKKIDSPGRHLNNIRLPDIGPPREDWPRQAVAIRVPYKFSISFENALSAGYTTEKIVHAFRARTIPIYWGNPHIGELFNPKAFINVHAFKNLDEAVKRVRELDNAPEAYASMLREPCMTPSQLAAYQKRQKDLEDFLYRIFSQDLSRARRRSHGAWNHFYEADFFRYRALKATETKLKAAALALLDKAGLKKR